MFWDEKDIRKEKIQKKNLKRARKGKDPKKYNGSRWVLNIMLFVFACVFIYAAYRLYNIFIVYHHNGKVKSEMQNVLYDELPTDKLDVETLIEEEVKPIDILGPLQKVNPEIIGWIHIDDTTIDYPVVKGTDNDYYLNHNVYKEDTICGAIFMDYRNNLNASQENFILYGHRMKDDSMFGHLSKFLKDDFYRQHPSFTLILPDGYYTCEIISVFKTTTYGFAYNRTHPGSVDEYMQFVRDCQAQSMYDTGVTVTEEDNIITLSTCDYSIDVDEGRLVVQAKLVKQGE